MNSTKKNYPDYGQIICKFAAQIRLTCWHGESKKFYLSQKNGALAFYGKFSYTVEALSINVKKVFVLLAKFGEFAGVGRLTRQGFGQARVSFEFR